MNGFKSILSGLHVFRFPHWNIVLNPFHEKKTLRIQLTHFHINFHMYLRIRKHAIKSKSKFLAQSSQIIIILYKVAFVQMNFVCRLLFVVKYRNKMSFSSANDDRCSTTQYENRMTFDHTHL